MRKLIALIALLSPVAGFTADYVWCQSEPYGIGKRYYSNVFSGEHHAKLTYQTAFENYLKARYVDPDALLTTFCFLEENASEAKSKRDESAASARSNIFNYEVIFLDWKY